MELWKNLTGVIATAMVGVVSVFLVIGGVVIMNVMLATVTERTREIGIRKASARATPTFCYSSWWKRRHGRGGRAIGVGVAYAISGLTTALTSVPMHVPVPAVLLAEVISAAVGVFFWRLSGAPRGKPPAYRSAAARIMKALDITVRMNIGENAQMALTHAA